MPRKKSKNPEQLLTHPIIVRVNQNTYKRLEKILLNSNCQINRGGCKKYSVKRKNPDAN